MDAAVICHGRGVRIADTRKALKDAARAGGSHIVQVDMHAPTEQDAEALLDMAYGCEANRIHDWVKGEAWNRRQGCWYDRDRRDQVYRGQGTWGSSSWRGDTLRGAMYHVAIYKRDEEYEARMAEWAAQFITADLVAAR